MANAFGYHAIQLGMPLLHGLRENRMPHRWLADDGATIPSRPAKQASVDVGCASPSTDGISLSERGLVVLCCDFDALPFPNQSLDLVILPHGLEWTRDPHLTLAEVERVLVPEGRVVILGMNARSLWGLGHWMGQWSRRLSRGRRGASWVLPRGGEWLGVRRVRDWLRLLSFEVETARFGCWRPALSNARWLSRLAWLDRWGERWWPALGAVYAVSAVKRIRGIRLVGLARRQTARPGVAPAVATTRRDAVKSRDVHG